MLQAQKDSVSVMNARHPAIRALALIALLTATLAVSACGRRGSLELPPGAVVEPEGAAASTAVNPTAGTPAARKRIPLDVLLD